jgi:tRNA (adenine57-N1/adenine58-N1)-methyltransferase
LDLPAPWEVIDYAKEALREDGKLCTFSPCIEQIQKTYEALHKANFTDLKMIECLLRPYEVRKTTFEVLPDSMDALPKPTTEVVSTDVLMTAVDSKEEQLKDSVTKDSHVESHKRNRDEFEGTDVTTESGDKSESGKQTESETQQTETKQKKRKGNKEKSIRAQTTIIGAKPLPATRGHTGFLVFARKPIQNVAESKVEK